MRRPDGTLVQGMAGALDPGPSATTAGYVGRSLSAGGSHLVFGEVIAIRKPAVDQALCILSVEIETFALPVGAEPPADIFGLGATLSVV